MDRCVHGEVSAWCALCRQPVSQIRTDLEVSPQRMLHTSNCAHWRDEDKSHWAVDLVGTFDDTWLGRKVTAQDGTPLLVKARCRDCG